MSGKVIMLMVDAMSYDACVEVAGAVEGWWSREARRQNAFSFCRRCRCPPTSRYTRAQHRKHGILSSTSIRYREVLTCSGLHTRPERKPPWSRTRTSPSFWSGRPMMRFETVRSMTIPSCPAWPLLFRVWQTEYNACLPGTFDICARGTHLIERFGSDYLFLHAVGADHVTCKGW